MKLSWWNRLRACWHILRGDGVIAPVPNVTGIQLTNTWNPRKIYVSGNRIVPSRQVTVPWSGES